MGAHALEQALNAGVAALGVALDRDAQRALLQYMDLLQRWSRVYNLTAVRDPQAMLVQHVLDSLAVVPALQRWAGSGHPVQRLADIGSGAGLPGLVVAVACPDVQMWCIDAVAKKVSFIRQAAAHMGVAAAVQALHTRVEDWTDPHAQGFDVVVSRAFASLADFVGTTDHLLAPHGVWLAMKGRPPADEIAALPPTIEVFHVEPLTVPGLQAQRCLVWMKKRTST